MPLDLTYINKSQINYLKLILSYKDDFNNKDLSIRTIALFLNDIKLFWLGSQDIVEFELEELSENKTCFLLSGATYLDLKKYEHYYFKAFGDYHILYDPFLKLEYFIFIPEDKINTKEIIDLFKRAFDDTLNILTTFGNHFYILPIREIAVKDDQENKELLNKFFINFISNLFNDSFDDQEQFADKYKTYEDIESALDDHLRQRLIFNDVDDVELSLRERIGVYCKNKLNISILIKEKSEPQIFLIILFSYISQAIEILLICTYLRINPYIRFNITMNYFSLLMFNFIKEDTVRNMVEKSLVFYVLYITFDRNIFKEIDFEVYCKKIEGKNLLSLVLEKIHSSNINLFEGGVKKASDIIKKEFEFAFS